MKKSTKKTVKVKSPETVKPDKLKICDSCKFSTLENGLRCHRNAPNPREANAGAISIWPAVHPASFCGEWND